MDGYTVTGLVVVFALILFYKPIAAKIGSISRAGKDGVSFEQPQQGGEVKPALLPFVEIMKLPVSPSELEREQAIEKQLQSLGLGNDSEKIAVLTRVLANARVDLELNRIAHSIFGSQVTLLVQLVGTSNGMSREQAEPVFEQAQKSFPELHGERKFDEWFAYLHIHNLATSNEGRIDINQFGKDFLKYLVDSRMAYPRYG